MRRLSESAGEKVLSRGSAEQVGALRHVVVDPAAGRIVALHVDGRKKKAQLVDWDQVVGFGPDAIVVEGEDALRSPAGDHELEVASGKLDLVGRLVLDDAGDALGTLSDLEFDEETGALEALVVGEHRCDPGRLRAIGPYCVIVAAQGALGQAAPVAGELTAGSTAKGEVIAGPPAPPA